MMHAEHFTCMGLLFWLQRASLLIAVLVASVVLGGRPALADGMPTEQERERIEINFLSMTIDHHEGAIQMARLAEKHATHAQLKSLASKIVKDQLQQQQQMQQWLKEWYNITKEPKLLEDNKPMIERLSGLTGADFEIAFLQEMIKHHRMGIPMMQPEAKNGAHQAARELAQKMIKDQKKEIKKMQKWLKAWYNIDSQ
ncbi:MAG TPA: DUF305 domain-containing protein [Armatimonadota bacterium]|nr:DUF305 domain-containing protein [Armatimonadota bacterium]